MNVRQQNNILTVVSSRQVAFFSTTPSMSYRKMPLFQYGELSLSLANAASYHCFGKTEHISTRVSAGETHSTTAWRIFVDVYRFSLDAFAFLLKASAGVLP